MNTGHVPVIDPRTATGAQAAVYMKERQFAQVLLRQHRHGIP